jgi:hypothetical protein
MHKRRKITVETTVHDDLQEGQAGPSLDLFMPNQQQHSDDESDE